MKIGLQINRFTWKGGDKIIGNKLAEIATTADKAGFYSIWVMDHFFQIEHIGEPQEPMLEAYTTLGYLAGLTKNAKLGTMVTGVIYRHPALLIKAVTTLDVLSNGRAYMGIGAAWNEQESTALGFSFPPLKERFERLEDALQMALRMWKGDDKEFAGKHVHAQWPMNHPQAISQPHPTILIGGGGEQKTLKLVAKYADACNLFARAGDEELKHKIDVLKKHCQDVGRDFNEIEITVLEQVRPADGKIDAQEAIEKCKHLKEFGVSHVIFGIRNVEDIKPLNVFGEKIIPEVSNL